MAKENKKNKSVDLVKAALRQLDFLKTVDNFPGLNGGQRVEQAIRRYETIWLPLAAQHPNLTLVPPLDVHWIWHCHMLAPYHYREDCMLLVNTVVDHKLLNGEHYKAALKKTQALWEKAYPQEPFQLKKVLEYNHRSQYNLSSAVSRQAAFYYQVSLPHYQNLSFLESAVRRYKQFLQLKKLNPDAFIVPCYDIDLIWHAHQLHPVTYYEETTNYLGIMLAHDDTDTDRSPGSKLATSYEATQNLWCGTFKQNYALPGCVYRGQFIRGHLQELTEKEVFAMSTKEAIITFSRASLQSSPDGSYGNVALKIFKLENRQLRPKSTRVITFSTSRSKWNSHIELGSFIFNTYSEGVVNFTLTLQNGKGCFSTKKNFIYSNFPMAKIVNNTPPSGMSKEHRVALIDKARNVENTCLLTFSTIIQPLTRGPCVVKARHAAFTTCRSPVDQAKLWGPIRLDSNNIAGSEYKTIFAEHSLFGGAANSQLKCRVLHCVEKMTSGVVVFYGDKILAFAHETGVELPAVQNTTFPSVYRLRGDRALIIKDNEGDWGILIGNWMDFSVGIPGTPLKPGKHGNQGRMTARFFDLRTGSIQRAVFNNRSHCTIGTLIVDLKTGRLEIGNNSFGQNVALAFSLAVLHVLCQPRPLRYNGQTNFTKGQKNGTKPIKDLEYETYVMLRSAGYLEVTPCNACIKEFMSSSGCAACHNASGCGGCGGGEGLSSCGGCA